MGGGGWALLQRDTSILVTDSASAYKPVLAMVHILISERPHMPTVNVDFVTVITLPNKGRNLYLR